MAAAVPTMHVLIAGYGWLGEALAGALVAAGHSVVGVRRSPGAAGPGRAGRIEALSLDLADARAVEHLPGGIDAVVACPSAGERSVDAYRRAYVEVNRNLLGRSWGVPLRAYVYTSSTGVLGGSDGAVVTEASPPSPASPTAEVLAQAERLVLDASVPPRGLPTCVVRLSGLYGPGRAGVIERVRTGRLALGPGDGIWTNWCHRDDAVSTVLSALERGEPGRVYHASDAHPARRREVVAWISERLGIEPPRRARAPNGPPRPDRRVSAEWTRRRLGVELAHPSFRDGLGPMLAEAGRARRRRAARGIEGAG